MAANKEQTFGDIPYTLGWTITSADGTNKKDVAVAEDDGAGLRIDFIRVATDLAANQDVEFFLFDGSTTTPLGVQTITAGAGKGASVSIIEALDKILSDSIGIQAGDKIQVAATAGITAGKTIWGTTLGVDLTAR